MHGEPNVCGMCFSCVREASLAWSRGLPFDDSSLHPTCGYFCLFVVSSVFRTRFILARTRTNGLQGARATTLAPYPSQLTSQPTCTFPSRTLSYTVPLPLLLWDLQTDKTMRVASRDRGLDAAPEGLEPFFCPSLPADGQGPCACSVTGAGGRRGTGDRRRRGGSGGRSGKRSARGGCALPPPRPRLFSFAAPGRDGVGTFYGVCLSVFRYTRLKFWGVLWICGRTGLEKGLWRVPYPRGGFSWACLLSVAAGVSIYVLERRVLVALVLTGEIVPRVFLLFYSTLRT